MMKTMSREMMRGTDERGDDDDADDDETKVAVLEGITRKNEGNRKKRSFTMAAPVPHRSKSCHLATSCLFSTSQWPEGDKQPCCLIGNRCYE